MTLLLSVLGINFYEPIRSVMETLDLSDLLHQFHKMNQPDIEAAGPDFLLSLPSQHFTILGDRDKLNRVLQNLVYNALSFTPEDGTIALSLYFEKSYACIQAADNGCGIPESLHQIIFERSFTTRQEAGGKGAVFTIRLHLLSAI